MLTGYKTYIGLLVALIPTIASLFGFEVSGTFSDEFTKLAEDAVTILGLGLAFYGRAKANSPGWFSKKS